MTSLKQKLIDLANDDYQNQSYFQNAITSQDPKLLIRQFKNDVILFNSKPLFYVNDRDLNSYYATITFSDEKYGIAYNMKASVMIIMISILIAAVVFSVLAYMYSGVTGGLLFSCFLIFGTVRKAIDFTNEKKKFIVYIEKFIQSQED